MAKRKRRWRGRLIPVFIGFLLTAVFMWLRITTVEPLHGWLNQLDNVVYDFQFKLIPIRPVEKDNPIVIVDIDEKSLAKFGSWPWPREVVAKMLRHMQEAGAVVVAFDVVFPSAEPNIAKLVISSLPEDKKNDAAFVAGLESLIPLHEQDNKLAEQMTEGDTVLGLIFHNKSDTGEAILSEPPTRISDEILATLVIPDMRGYTGNIAELQNAAQFAGFVTTIPDPDGIIRRSPLVLRYKDGIYSSLALEAARLYLLEENYQLDIVKIGDFRVVEGIKLGPTYIPTDAVGRVVVPYRGPAKTFPYLSAADIITGKFNKKSLANKMVFVGTSALGMGDFRATPVQSVYPGVEVHANIADAILEKNFPSKPSWGIGAELFMVFTVGFFCAIMFPALGPGLLTSVSIFFPIGLTLLSAWLWEDQGLILSFVVPMLLVITLAMMNMSYGFLFEGRQKRQIKYMFGQYVPVEHVDQMTKNPGDYAMSGETRELTVLFADIRNFTSISERLSANELKSMLNEFLTPMTRIIFQHSGTIDKYVGDMVMAFWGAPLPDEEHARHGILAALSMLKETEKIRAEFIEMKLPEISIGVGLNTGLMNVGDMGSEFRRAYTVLGDAVNLGSRLEGLTKFYGVNLVVSEYTRAGQDDFVFKRLDRVKVKGKQDAVEVFEPIGLKKDVSDEQLDEVDEFEAILELYFKKKWKKVIKGLKRGKKKYPHAAVLYDMYLNRVQYYEDNPPGKNWDGSFERREK